MTEPSDLTYGFVSSPSTSSVLTVSTYTLENQDPIIGQMVYLDQPMSDGFLYRALGTVTDVTTNNADIADPLINLTTARGRTSGQMAGSDLKALTLRIQTVYRSPDQGDTWQQYGSALPTSPDTGVHVRPLTAEIIHHMLAERTKEIVSVGTFRGLHGVPVPMTLPGFRGPRGAFHSAIVGRSGVGKTAFAHFLFLAEMRNEEHAIVVIDPQGQWASENGFLFSLQKAAAALGRQVNVLRVSEDIRLPLRQDLLSYLMMETRMWSGLQRMGEENQRQLSDIVARKIEAALRQNENLAARPLLDAVFTEIAQSDATLSRIYASGGDQFFTLKGTLSNMVGIPFINKKGDEVEPSDADRKDADQTWKSLLERFIPLINLFSPTNLAGNRRQRLHGEHGVLSTVLRTRAAHEPGPYVVLDMSSDTSLNARAAYASTTGLSDQSSNVLQMRQMLDNPDIKAYIVAAVLDSIKSRAESAFAEQGGNLDTQIVFDEAWRYAPRTGRTSGRGAIYELSEKLAGFARDTRKYGIGWTYILQSPTDLNETIWRQLSSVYTGFGMLGSDKNMLVDLIDDNSQIKLYEQFADPASTGIYPFMATGPVNPLIFTSTPTFLNVFNNVEQMIEANRGWMDDICARQNLPRFTAQPETIKLGASKPSFARKPKPVQPAPSITGTQIDMTDSLGSPF